MERYVRVPESQYLELLRYREAAQSFEMILHAPEFRKEFVKKVEEAEKRVKKGKGKKFLSLEELDSYLESPE